MKILLVSDIQLNAQNPEKLSLKSFHKWQNDRMLKLEDLLDKAQQKHAKHVLLSGVLFGQKIIPEKMVDSFFNAVKAEKDVEIYALCGFEEYQLISYRNDIPANFHLLCIDVSDQKQFKDLTFALKQGTAELSADGAKGTIVLRDDAYELNGNRIPSFEPVGFDDVEGKTFGYMLWDTSKRKNTCEVITDQKYKYSSTELRIEPEDKQDDILEKINAITKKADQETFLRITITGKTAFGLTINTDGLRNKLTSRVFNTEVYDNSIMDVDREMFENDISLRSEFVRLALNDDSLSESERNRLISYGWNALSGKEMTEE